MLEVKNIDKNYKGLKALSNVSFSVDEHEIVGLIGPNGAGKTTLFNAISGFAPANKGTVFFDGVDITKAPPDKACKLGIGRTFQITKPFLDITVLQTVTIGALNRTKTVPEAVKLAEEIIETVGLGACMNFMGKELNVAQRKRMELARALATQPKLLLLDEVVAGLNPTEVNKMITLIEQIASTGIGIIIVEHILKVVMQLSHRVIVLHHGELIAEDIPSSLMDNKKVVQVYLGGGIDA